DDHVSEYLPGTWYARGKYFPGGDQQTGNGVRHKGIVRYTVGQRKGLNISLGKRVFVTKINAADNTVTLADTPLMQSVVRVGGLEFSKLTREDIKDGITLGVKLRYLAPIVDARVRLVGDEAILEFDTPQKSPTPGQSCVFYDGEDVAFGGIIL
ncbi:MAG: hypothetical protein IIX96_00315, partial [Clostridia bacterium]|nr:hypothetical protein [Clostridia bacterium]